MRIIDNQVRATGLLGLSSHEIISALTGVADLDDARTEVILEKLVLACYDVM